MSKTAGIVYGVESGIVRYIICPDGYNSLAHVNLQPGEAMVRVDYADEFDPSSAASIVEKLRGKPADDARCVIVDADNKVSECVMADPLIDLPRNKSQKLLRAPTAAVGDIMKSDGTFERPTPPVVIPDIQTPGRS